MWQGNTIPLTYVRASSLDYHPCMCSGLTVLKLIVNQPSTFLDGFPSETTVPNFIICSVKQEQKVYGSYQVQKNILHNSSQEVPKYSKQIKKNWNNSSQEASKCFNLVEMVDNAIPCFFVKPASGVAANWYWKNTKYLILKSFKLLHVYRFIWNLEEKK